MSNRRRVDHEQLYILAHRHERLLAEGRKDDAERTAVEITRALLREEAQERRRASAKNLARVKPAREPGKAPGVQSVMTNNVGRGKRAK